MHDAEPLSLPDRLVAVARLWAAANGRSLGALASIVANHGSFFDRLRTGNAGTTTATLEKFAAFLSDGANWPGGQVPAEVCEFAHVVGISSAACAASPDSGGGEIGSCLSAEAGHGN